MKARGKKQKGSRLERQFARLIRTSGADKGAKRMPLSGAFEGLKSDIFTTLPYSFECKNQERIQLWKWWEQTTEQAHYAKAPILVVSGNHRPILCVLKAEDLLTLIKETKI